MLLLRLSPTYPNVRWRRPVAVAARIDLAAFLDVRTLFTPQILS
jgi:hypothetical protein